MCAPEGQALPAGSQSFAKAVSPVSHSQLLPQGREGTIPRFLTLPSCMHAGHVLVFFVVIDDFVHICTAHVPWCPVTHCMLCQQTIWTTTYYILHVPKLARGTYLKALPRLL